MQHYDIRFSFTFILCKAQNSNIHYNKSFSRQHHACVAVHSVTFEQARPPDPPPMTIRS